MSEIPIILATGFAEGLDEEIAIKAGIGQLMMKPFTPEKLSHTVRDALKVNG